MAFGLLAGVLWVETRPELSAGALLGGAGYALLPAVGLLCALLACDGGRDWLRTCAQNPRLRRAAIATAAAALLGAAWTACRASLLLGAQLDASLENRDLVVTGEVVSLPSFDGQRAQFDLALSPRATGLPLRARLSWYEAPALPRAGERWQLEVRLKQRRGFSNPGGFDYEGHLFREGVGATGYVRRSPFNRRLAGPRATSGLLRVREAIALRMRAVLRGSDASGVLTGLAVGATDEIGTARWQVFAATGTTHLVAISGLHVTMIAALAMAVTSALWRRWPGAPRRVRADVASAAGLVSALGYALLAGMSVPTQRTLLMLFVAFAAGWLRRAHSVSQVLSLALVAVLLLDPHAAVAPGFWLSFGAVAALLAAFDRPRRAGGRIVEFLRAQGVVTVALLPVTLAFFGSISLVAPLANLYAIPLFTLVLVPATLLGVALLFVIPPAGERLLELTALGFEKTWPLLERLAELPAALVHPVPPDGLLLCALAVSALAAVTVLPARAAVLGLVLLLPLAYPREQRPADGEFELTVLDVGQGLAIAVRTRNHALLYDAGPRFRSGRSAGELAVVPFLHHEGIGRLDLIVTSHDDADHAGGMPAVVRALPVIERRTGGRPSALAEERPCRRGERWNWDGVTIEMIHPQTPARWNDNEGSCVLYVRGRGGGALLTGDIEHGAEEWLAREGGLPRVDVIVVPHHGSRSSSSAALIAATAPRVALVSTGYRNRWHFPRAEVVERWCEAGAPVLDTSRLGAIRIAVAAGPGAEAPVGHRQQSRRYWRARPGGALCAQPAAGTRVSARGGQYSIIRARHSP